MIRHYSTNSVIPARRSRYWDEIVGDAFPGGAVQAFQDDFHAELWSWSLKDVGLMRARSNRSLVSRWKQQQPSGTDTGRMMIHIQNGGMSETKQGNTSMLTPPGGIAICDALQPYDVSISNNNDLLVLELPTQSLLGRGPVSASCRNIASTNPAASILRKYALSVCNEYQATMDVKDIAIHSEILLSLVALVLSKPDDALTRQAATGADELIAWVEDHLFEPGLNTSVIAGVHGCSERTIQMIFAQRGTTPRDYIVGRRLERSREMLADPAHSERTITEIAFAVGFNDSGYFSRAFRRYFKTTPRIARRTHFI